MKTTQDPEQIVRMAHEGAWSDAWAAVHRVASRVGTDERLAWAASTLEDAFFAHVASAPVTPSVADAIETVVLLHSGGLYRVEAARFASAVEQLVAYHRATGDAASARRYARFCPDAPTCAVVLESDAPASFAAAPSGDGATVPAQNDDPVETSAVRHARPDAADVTQTTPLTGTDRTRSLFRSPQERTFFHAVREVFPTYTPYPNVALRSVLDTDALKPYLRSDERSLLYTGVVDCVLFDAHDGYRPRAFFELDSSYHDAPDRRANDARKDRILALAGCTLTRLRPSRADVSREDWIAILRSIDV